MFSVVSVHQSVILSTGGYHFCTGPCRKRAIPNMFKLVQLKPHCTVTSPLDILKLVHYEVHMVSMQAVGILLECFLPAATKLGQGNVFTSICLSTGGRGVCLSACWDTPPDQAPPRPGTPQTRHPPGPGTPGTRHPLEADTPPRPGTPWTRHPAGTRHPPGTRHLPPQEADCSIRLTSGQYASYWNAFFFLL